jgi:proteasome lid subunit RPN8/RPN11
MPTEIPVVNMIIGRELAKRLEEHARREAPKEACGVLAGRGGVVEEVYECTNVDELPEARYTIKPEELLRAVEDIEEKGLELLGFYHSHPMGMTKPSSIDEGRMSWPGYSYVIVSIEDGVEFSSWIWKEGKFEEEEVEID